ncbi:MAG: hypothetical protein IPI67_38430 [Myxococcales bacterium]|nr:hypothetical protein [Myxococcales bacterium]
MKARVLALLIVASPASALADAGTAADAGAGGRVTATCTERWPEGKPRPKLSEQFPTHGTSGHAATLELGLEHGKGETVLPGGFRLELDSEAARVLERAGFALPDPDGGAGPTIGVVPSGETAKSTVRIPLVLLPPKPGRHELELPPLPLAIARASGEVVTLCTAPHAIIVDDPIASTPNAMPKENPAPRPQREVWTAAKQVAVAALIALLVGALLTWLVGRWRARPKPEPPPIPPRPPWEVAIEELVDLRARELVKNERFSEHYARVSHIVRKYCGDRYGFDGLESTTREMLSVLRRVIPAIVVLPEIEESLRHADLVKFARLTPSADECREALERAENIVRRTVPLLTEPRLPPPGAEPPPPAEPDEARAP